MNTSYAVNEQRVRAAAALGEVADFTTLPGYDPEQKPQISAVFLRRLMLGLERDGAGLVCAVLLPGVRIRGAHLDGVLDLTDCAGANGAGLPALSLEACDLPHRMDLSAARLARLSLDDSRFRELWGVGLKVDGDLTFNRAKPAPAVIGGDDTALVRLRAARIGGDLYGRGARLVEPTVWPEGHSGNDATVLLLQASEIAGNVMLDIGFSAHGCTWLFGAKIGGTLSCSAARFSNAGGDALVADNAQVGGSVLLRAYGSQRFEAEGAVILSNASIGGTLDCAGGRFSNAGREALVAPDAKIGGSVLLCFNDRQRFEADGGVYLSGAKIGGALFCDGGRFANPGGDALIADRAEIGGSIWLRAIGSLRFEAEGAVILSAIRVGGTLDCEGGHFANAGGDALAAVNADIGGDVLLRAEGSLRFDAEGSVSLFGARIGRDLELVGADLKQSDFALNLQTTRIEGQLSMWRNNVEGRVSLAGLRVARLFDDPDTGWGDPKSKAQIDLNEIDLDTIGVPRLASRPLWRGRARWLRRNTGAFMGVFNGTFSNQPWREVASAFERAGLHGDARRIRREEQRAANKSRPLWQRPFVWLFAEQMFGFGLSATRAATTALLFWVMGAAGAGVMEWRGALVAAQAPDKPALACESFHPPLYALDVALPVLDLKQESACEPGAAPGAQLFKGISTPFGMLGEEIALWSWAKALYSVFGALITGFAILTWTGVFKPRAQTS